MAESCEESKPIIKEEMQVDENTSITSEIDIKLEVKSEHDDENNLTQNQQELIPIDIKTEIKKEEPTTTTNSTKSKPNEKKLVPNPLKRKRTRTRVRNRSKDLLLIKNCLQNLNNEMSANKPQPSEEPKEQTQTQDGQEREYILTVSNVPKNWSYMDIKNYIDTECGPIDEIELIKDDEAGWSGIRLIFQSEEECLNAMNKLKDKEVEGNKLTLKMTVEAVESDTETQSDKTESTNNKNEDWQPDLDVWEVDPKGVYGLKMSFLKSLNIKPPIDKWIAVSNFRCDKSELRDVMELAGKVLSCSVFTGNTKTAYVMYSHPLEAVQAVSMLNNQSYYGQALKVYMTRSPSQTILLPKGLTGIGKGLGLKGKPLRNLVKHFKNFLSNETNLIDPQMFDLPVVNTAETPDVNFKVQTVADVASTSNDTANKDKPPQSSPKTPIVGQKVPIVESRQPNQQNNQRANQFANGPRPITRNIGPHGPGLYGAGPPLGPYGQGPRMGPFGPNAGWNGPRGPTGPNGPMGPIGPMCRPGPLGPPIAPPMGPVTLHLSNLPPSTTFFSLSGKLAQFGQIVSIQLTTPGCAVVTYANQMQADKCYHATNGAFSEGHVIQVKYT